MDFWASLILHTRFIQGVEVKAKTSNLVFGFEMLLLVKFRQNLEKATGGSKKKTLNQDLALKYPCLF